MALPKAIVAPTGPGGGEHVNKPAPDAEGPGPASIAEGEPNMQDAADGELIYKADPPASRMKFIGTVAGDAQRKPFTLKG